MSSLHTNLVLTHDMRIATSHGSLPDLVQTPSDELTKHKYDSYHLIKIVMFVIGIGAVLSPNALLLCASYYRESYNDHIIYYIMPIYSISYIICLFILTGTKCAISTFSFTSRIIISFVLCAITLFGLVRFARPRPWDSYILALIVFVIGMTSSILNQSLLGFTNILDPSYRHILISGEELSGISASIIRVITRLCYGNDPVGSANTYFIVITSYCALCAALFASIRFTDYVAIRLNIYVLYMARYKSPAKKSLFSPYTQAQRLLQQQRRSNSHLDQIHETHSESTRQTDSTTHEMESEEHYKRISIDDEYQTAYKHSLSLANASAKSLPLQNETSTGDHDLNDLIYSFQYKPHSTAPVVGAHATNQSLMASARKHKGYSSTKKRYSSLLFDDASYKSLGLCKISKRLRSYCLIMLLSNILSWSVVPGMIGGKIKSDLMFIRVNDWQSILLMSEYFISNYLGRLVMSSPSFWWCCCEYNDFNTITHVVIRNLGCCPICCGKSDGVIAQTFLIWLCIWRILFIYPLFIVIYLNIYDINWIAHLLMIGTGISQGYIYHMAFELAPQFAPKYRQETAILMLRFFHFGGIAIGSITALVVNYIDTYSTV